MGFRGIYREKAYEVALYFVEKNIRLVYGGANVGLMRILADTMLQKGGEVIGVMPRRLVDREVAHLDLTEMHIVDSMSERKTMMVELSDAFITLPGGFGTLDELAEVLTYNQLRLSDKPIGILNVDGYFDMFLKFLDHAAREGFVRQEHRSNLIIDEDIDSLLQKMQNFKPVEMEKWMRDIHEESR